MPLKAFSYLLVVFCLSLLIYPRSQRISIELLAQADEAQVFYRQSGDVFYGKRYVRALFEGGRAKLQLPSGVAELKVRLKYRSVPPAALSSVSLSVLLLGGVPVELLAIKDPLEDGPSRQPNERFYVVPIGHSWARPGPQAIMSSALLTVLLAPGLLIWLRKRGGGVRVAPALASAGVAVVLLGGRVVAENFFEFAPQSSAPFQLTLVDRHGKILTNRTGGVLVRLNPFTAYRMVPNQETAAFATDERGYRRTTSPDATPRPIGIVLGGSAAFGHSIANDSAVFPSQLNVLVRQLRFYNASVISWQSGQELAEMVHFADDLRPRLYISFDGFNELFYRSLDSFGYNQFILESVEERLAGFSAAGRGDARPRRPLSDEEITLRYAENLKKMHAFARSRGAHFLAVIQPDLSIRKTPGPNELKNLRERDEYTLASNNSDFSRRYVEMSKNVEAICRSAGISVLNLNLDADIQTSPQEMFVDFIHPSEAGHELIAKKIAAQLQRLLRTKPHIERSPVSK